MNEDKAPSCPVSYSQEPKNPRGTLPVRLPSIPIATDLPSLIRSVNIMRDILRSLTTSLTVNNTYVGTTTPSRQFGTKSYIMSDYDSDWYQTAIDNKEGSVFYKSKSKGVDKEQRASIERIDAVRFRNNARDNDQSFEWRYVKKLDQEGFGDPVGTPFQEDFFERVVNVHWQTIPENFLVAGVSSGGDTPVLIGSKDGTKWTSFPPPPGNSVTGLAYVEKTWFATTFSYSAVEQGGTIYRSTDDLKSWQLVYTATGSNFDSHGGGGMAAAGIPRKGGKKPPPTVVVGADTGVATILVSQNLGATWRTVAVGGSDDEVKAVSFANGLFFVSVKHEEDHPDPTVHASKGSFYLMVSDNGIVWAKVPVLTGLSSLQSTDYFGDARYMYDGDIVNVTWNGDKENPQYIVAATGYFVNSVSAMGIATSKDGRSWTDSGGPFGDWSWDRWANEGTAYTAYENDPSTIAAGQVSVSTSTGTSQKKTLVCIPATKYSGAIQVDYPHHHNILSSESGNFTSVSGGLDVTVSGIIPSVSGGSTAIGTWHGPSAFSNKNGGTFLATFNQKQDWHTDSFQLYIGKKSNTAWQPVGTPLTGINTKYTAIAVGLIQSLEKSRT
jgi:hypothetical protein